jgi:D-glycerate 3-kinase
MANIRACDSCLASNFSDESDHLCEQEDFECSKWRFDSTDYSGDAAFFFNELSISSASTRASSKEFSFQNNPPLRTQFSELFDESSEFVERPTVCLAKSLTATLAISAEAEVIDFVRCGPLFGKLEKDSLPFDADWLRLGALIVGEIASPCAAGEALPSLLERSVAVRVYHLYLPMYFWMRNQVRKTVASRLANGVVTRRAVAISLSAPQGCGKTTVVTILTKLFAADGLRCASVSIDDFYLTGASQDALATRHADNTILQVRGNAGTHDLPLGEATLRELLGERVRDVLVPVYDKSARCGRGDRAPASHWRVVSSPCDVVLFEGWMSGFKPVGLAAQGQLAAIHPSLPEIDRALAGYSSWDELMDAWCVVGLEDKANVFKWRLEAERKMSASGRPGMSDEKVRDFVARYMPAYEAYCPRLYRDAASTGVDGKPTLFIRVDGSREPVF